MEIKVIPQEMEKNISKKDVDPCFVFECSKKLVT